MSVTVAPPPRRDRGADPYRVRYARGVAGKSSVTLLRVGDEPRVARRLRLRADQTFAERLGPPEQPDEVARLRIPCREPVADGERIGIEISFGAMVDEVELEGRVAMTLPGTGGAPPILVVALDERHRAQLAYVQSVLGGQRSPSARAHRRVPVDVAVRWRCGELRQNTRARDLSRGGAYLLSHLQPGVGSSVEVEFEGDDTTPILRLSAVVSWVRRMGATAGFGVRFLVRSRDEAEYLQRWVRVLESRGEPATRGGDPTARGGDPTDR